MEREEKDAQHKKQGRKASFMIVVASCLRRRQRTARGGSGPPDALQASLQAHRPRVVRASLLCAGPRRTKAYPRRPTAWTTPAQCVALVRAQADAQMTHLRVIGREEGLTPCCVRRWNVHRHPTRAAFLAGFFL